MLVFSKLNQILPEEVVEANTGRVIKHLKDSRVDG